MSHRVIFGGARSMWVLAMYDLPVKSSQQRRNYQRFHESLVRDGFDMLQFSVYARPCPTIENASVHADRIEDAVPDEGQVRVLILTALQFSKMKIFLGKNLGDAETEPPQLSFW